MSRVSSLLMLNHHPEFSEEEVRQFLLTTLGSEKQHAFESSLLANEQLERRVRLAEFELCDDYAARKLTRSDAKLFESSFLITNDRKVKLRVSRALHDQLRATEVTSSRSSFLAELASSFNLRPTSWRVGFAALVFLLLLGAAWLVIKKEPQIKHAITERIGGRGISPQRGPSEANHPTNRSMPEHQNPSSPAQAHPVTVEPELMVFIRPSTTSETTRDVSITVAAVTSVRFELALPGKVGADASAQLLTVQGQSVFSTPAAVFPDKVTIDVPASFLKQGEFQIRLTDTQSKVLIANYYFSVQ